LASPYSVKLGDFRKPKMENLLQQPEYAANHCGNPKSSEQRRWTVHRAANEERQSAARRCLGEALKSYGADKPCWTEPPSRMDGGGIGDLSEPCCRQGQIMLRVWAFGLPRRPLAARKSKAFLWIRHLTWCAKQRQEQASMRHLTSSAWRSPFHAPPRACGAESVDQCVSSLTPLAACSPGEGIVPRIRMTWRSQFPRPASREGLNRADAFPPV
jgi:hypothetical protein